MKKTFLRNIAFASVFMLSLATVSCKDKNAENESTDMETTTGSTDESNTKTMDNDVDTSDSTNTVNPDTIMGP